MYCCWAGSSRAASSCASSCSSRGLGLFGLRSGFGRVLLPAQGSQPLPGRRFQQRLCGKEFRRFPGAFVGLKGALLGGSPGGIQLALGYPHVAAGLFQGGAGGLPGGLLCGGFLVQLLDHGVLPGFVVGGTGCIIGGLCLLQGGAGGRQPGEFIQSAAAHHLLVLVVPGFGGGALLLGLGQGGGAVGELCGQRLGSGPAGGKADVPLGTAQPLQPEGVVTQQVTGGAVRGVLQGVRAVAAADAPQQGVRILGPPGDSGWTPGRPGCPAAVRPLCGRRCGCRGCPAG